MLKQVSAAILCLLVLASCAPTKPEVRIDGTSKEAFEKSLVLMASGLSSDQRAALSEAIEILQSTDGLKQLGYDTNMRIKVSGKTRTELIDEATAFVLKYYSDNREKAELYGKCRALVLGKLDATIVSWRYGRVQDGGREVIVQVKYVNRSDRDIVVLSTTIDNTDYNAQVGQLAKSTVAAGQTKTVEITGDDPGNPINRASTIREILVEVPSLSNMEFSAFNLLSNDPWGPTVYADFLKHIGHKRQIPS
jgi:hypothetical protein